MVEYYYTNRLSPCVVGGGWFWFHLAHLISLPMSCHTCGHVFISIVCSFWTYFVVCVCLIRLVSQSWRGGKDRRGQAIFDFGCLFFQIRLNVGPPHPFVGESLSEFGALKDSVGLVFVYSFYIWSLFLRSHVSFGGCDRCLFQCVSPFHSCFLMPNCSHVFCIYMVSPWSPIVLSTFLITYSTFPYFGSGVIFNITSCKR